MTGTFPTAPTPLAPTAAPTATPTENIDLVIGEWFAASEALAAAKKTEKALRDQVSNSHLWNAAKTTGTQTYDLGKGYELKMARTETVSVANKEHEATHCIIKLRNLGEGATERANRLFTFSARMSEAVYKELTAEERMIVDPIITRKPGSTSIKLKAPKE
jgi:hypothetical protein